ncbi:MAG: sugar phosphate isomerase/epimerase family protein, partial [Chloroflexota bacterium]
MRVGVDGRKIPRAAEYGPFKSFNHAQELGMEGLFFRTVLEMSPTLDHGELREIKAHADSLGMYVESGLGKVNPYATPEAPELRAAGDGDILLGFRRMLEACHAGGITEVWIGTANFKGQYRGNFAYDRFRTDVTWPEQLEATERFLHKLAPIARDLGIHINLETHEEITTFEVVRLVEAVGPDVMGITFDIA